MSTADDIRSYVIEHYIGPARAAGRDKVKIRLGDIRQNLKHSNPLQTVRSALNTQIFQKEAGVELLEPIDPRSGADTHCHFGIRSLPSKLAENALVERSDATVSLAGHEVRYIEVAKLRLDLKNPSFIGRNFKNETEAITFLYENADLSELLLSILISGYLDFEPIVVHQSDNTVLEGNRRVAALRLISNETLRNELNINLPSAPTDTARPDSIRAVFVRDAAEARHFIGFKHINGPQKWSALSKAKYAADWHEEGTSLEEISRALGDTFNTVTRLVVGYRVYKQAVANGFDPERRSARRLAFSHLYTALTRSSIKQWLDLDESAADKPVPEQNLDRLRNLMSWLYGQGDHESALVRTQNPDLNRLADVIGNKRTLEMLVAGRDLLRAFEELVPQSKRLEDALIQAVRHTEAAAAIQASFDGRAGTYELGQRLFLASRSLFKTFRDFQDKAVGLDEDQ